MRQRGPALMRLALLLAAVVILLDQVSKWVVVEHVMRPPRIIPVTDFFNLVFTFNRGVSFGLLSSDSPWAPWLLSAFALAVCVGLLVWLHSLGSRLAAVGIGMIVGGAIGNVIDRVRFGAVVDFLDFHVGGWHWPAFNIADSAITVGVIMIVLQGLFAPDGETKKQTHPGE